MRAAFMTGRNQIEVREADEPALDPRGAILRVEACGICGTDARTFFNGDPRAPAPWVLGHEPVGILERAGPEAVLPPEVEVGGRVFLGSILTCGQCLQCTDGRQNLCEHHLLYGYDPFPGAYAELAAVPPIAVTNLIRTHLATAGHANIDRELRANSMLGRLCGYWIRECGGTLPADYQARLIERRNAATHTGAHIREADERDAITVAREILDQATPLPL